MVSDAVQCHFEEGERPQIIRLHFVKEEVLAVQGCRAISERRRKFAQLGQPTRQTGSHVRLTRESSPGSVHLLREQSVVEGGISLDRSQSFQQAFEPARL